MQSAITSRNLCPFIKFLAKSSIMSQIAKSNMHLLCRICLCTVRPAAENEQTIELDSNLAKLILIFTTIDVDEDGDIYPRKMCQLCYDILQDFQSFRCAALRSNQELHSAINEETGFQTENVNVKDNLENHFADKHKSYESDDDQFILPDSSEYLCPKLIKTESEAYEEVEIEAVDEKCLSSAARLLRQQKRCERTPKVRRKRRNASERLFCKICEKSFNALNGFKIHMNRHANIKKYVCKVCGASKVTLTELHTHMRIHDPLPEKFKCTICPQEFNHKNAIQRHIRAVHEGLRPFPCNYCPKRFGTRNSKICHERLHTGERPFVCDICNKAFVQAEGLNSHMKNHDKSLRTHVCKYCSQRFITRRNLIDHEARHQSDKPHICQFCSRGFFKQEEMIAHRSEHLDDIEY